MAPPFSPDDDDDDEVARPRSRRAMPTAPPTSPFSTRREGPSSLSYEDNVLANPELLNLGESKKAGEKGASKVPSQEDSDKEEDEDEDNEYYSKLKRGNQKLEKQRKFNKVTVEIPLVLTRQSAESEGLKEDAADNPEKAVKSQLFDLPTLKLSQDAKFAFQCHVPPSTPDGRWTGDIHGNAKVNQLVGSTNGSAQVTYKYNTKTRLLGSLDMLSTASNTRPFQIRLGAQYQESSQSTIQMSLQQQAENNWGFNLSTRDVLDPWILSSNLWWNPRKGQVRTSLSAASMTTHRVRLLLGLRNLDHSKPTKDGVAFISLPWLTLPLATVQVNLDPKLSPARRAPMVFQYYPGKGTWNVSLAMHTTKPAAKKTKKQKQPPMSMSSSWQIGIQGGATLASGWNILLAWTHGDITLRIPILLSTTTLALTKKGGGKEDNKLIKAAVPLAALAISGIAQEILARCIWGKDVLKSPDDMVTSSSSTHPSDAIPATKARQDAQSQQYLMKRQAENRKANEAKKNGLVIQQATYRFEDLTWDVTIPLQFWVSPDTSTLTLSAESKQYLLGFYPLARAATKKNETSDQSESEKNAKKSSRTRIPWWKEYWTPTTKRSTRPAASKASKETKNVPTLEVKYNFQGQSYDITIRDDESLKLPHKSTAVVT